jgi:hypothetical protein
VCQGCTSRSDSDEQGARRAQIRWVLACVCVSVSFCVWRSTPVYVLPSRPCVLVQDCARMDPFNHQSARNAWVPPAPPPSDDDGGGLPLWAIILIAVLCGLLLLCCLWLLVLAVKRRRRAAGTDEEKAKAPPRRRARSFQASAAADVDALSDADHAYGQPNNALFQHNHDPVDAGFPGEASPPDTGTTSSAMSLSMPPRASPTNGATAAFPPARRSRLSSGQLTPARSTEYALPAWAPEPSPRTSPRHSPCAKVVPLGRYASQPVEPVTGPGRADRAPGPWQSMRGARSDSGRDRVSPELRSPSSLMMPGGLTRNFARLHTAHSTNSARSRQGRPGGLAGRPV